jgi:hypothetical protein
MRRIIVFTLLALTLGSGAAFADHYRRGDYYRNDRRGDYYRGDRYRSDYRAGAGVTIRNPNEPVWTQRDRRVSYRRPVYVSNGYYQFHTGHRYRYERPIIHTRYYDYRVRPQIVVENYQPMTGYVWVPGQWQWNGYEWIWTSGYYSVDPSCDDDGIRY